MLSDGPLHYHSARTMREALAAGAVTAAELLDAHIARYEETNAAINAVIRTDLPAARARARELDRMAEAGKTAGPLHGLPLTLKDTFDVSGMPASAGAPEYAARPPSVPDSAVAARLKAAGAIIWGKTNTPYLAGDNQTFNAVHGRTNNPWDAARTPGGSSGGAAAAVSTGITPLEVGSDIGGSLRIPAHFCGVAALKPTFGRVPIIGHVPPAPGSASVRDLNVAGPMARSAGDLRLLFSVLADTPAPPPRRTDLRGRRIGVWADQPGFPLSAQCRDAVEHAADVAQELEAQVAGARPPIEGDALLDLYLRLLLPVLATDMPQPLVKTMEMGRPFAKLLASREPFSRSKWALYSAATHHDWLKANEAREKLKRDMADMFTRYDAIIAPVAPSAAFEHVQKGDSVTRKLLVDGAPAPYHAFHSWIALATICHLPAVTIPVSQQPGQLPAGIQIIGPEGADLDVLAIAEALEGSMGGFVAPPALTVAAEAPKAAKRKTAVRQKPAKKPKKK